MYTRRRWGYGYGNYNGSVISAKCSFALAYINSDTIPELLVLTYDRSHADGYGMLYTYRNNKIDIISRLNLNHYQDLFYYRQKGILTDEIFYFGYGSISYLYLSNENSIKQLNMSQGYNSVEMKNTYSINSKSVSSTQFNNELKKYVGNTGKTMLKFYDNTEYNRKRYLK